MSPFVVVALVAQLCLIQTVMSQMQCGYGQAYGSYIQAPQAALQLSPVSSVSSASCGSYGGQGTGNVAVAGDVGVAGNTVVVGSVPVLGAVDFSGAVPATGSVSISGKCGCGCA